MTVKDLDWYLKDFIGRRTDEVSNWVSVNHADYRELSKGVRSSLAQLFENLPTAKHHLIFEYEEKTNQQMVIIGEQLYRQGLMDGLAFRNRLLKHTQGEHIHSAKD